MANKDYYKTLGVMRGASESDIKLAYRKLARQYHPDVNKGDTSAETRFKEINEAYAVLADKEKRARYDQFGEYWEQAPGAGGGPGGGARVNVNFQDLFGGRGGDFGDMFSEIFSRGGASRGGGMPWEGFGQGRAYQPADVEAELPLTLEEAFNGTERTVQLQREDTCGRCRGAGRSGKTVCADCRGSGQTVTPRRIDVKVPKGVREGTHIRVRGEGGTAADGRARDLYLVVRLQPDPRYEVKGDDLYAKVPVSVTEAVLGAEIKFPTLRGTAQMVVPPGTGSHTVFRLSGQGFPAAGSNKAGDLYVEIKIVTPRNLTAEEKDLYRQLASLRPENPRSVNA